MEKERLNLLVNCYEISFFNSFRIFVGRPLGPTDLLSFSNKIKLVISSKLVGLRKKEFSLGCWRNSSNDLCENLTVALVFSAMVKMLAVFLGFDTVSLSCDKR